MKKVGDLLGQYIVLKVDEEGLPLSLLHPQTGEKKKTTEVVFEDDEVRKYVVASNKIWLHKYFTHADQLDEAIFESILFDGIHDQDRLTPNPKQ